MVKLFFGLWSRVLVAMNFVVLFVFNLLVVVCEMVLIAMILFAKFFALCYVISVFCRNLCDWTSLMY